MMFNNFYQRQIEKEARFCYRGLPNAPNSGPHDSEFDKAGKWAAYGIEGLSIFMARISAEMVEQTARVVISLPVGFAKGVSEGLRSVDTDKAFQDLMRIGDFFKTLPFMRNIFPTNPNAIKHIETIRNLTDHSQWLAAFRAADIMTRPAEPLPATDDPPYGPLKLLLSLSPEKRQEIYTQFVHVYISPDVLESKGLLPANPDDNAFEPLKNKVGVLNATLGAMMGEEKGVWKNNLTDPEIPEVEGMAKRSLERYYERNDIARQQNFIPDVLRQDYRDGRLLLTNLNDSILTDVNQLKNAIPAGRLRGALEMGVVNRKDLDVLHAGLENEKHMHRIVTSEVANKLQNLSGAAKENAEQEVKGIANMFGSLSGIEKLLLIGGGLFALAKSKFVRTSALVLGGAYFFQRLVMKEKDPLAKWSDLVYGITGKAKKASAGMLGEGIIPGHIGDISNRADTMVRFLDDFTRRNLEQQAVGFGLLSDMPLSLLASQFTMEGQIGERMRLNTSADTPLDIQMRLAMKRHGWDEEGYREFFDNKDNQGQVSEAMSYVFFQRAAEDPRNAQDVALIRETLGRYMPGIGIADFAQYALSGEINAKNYEGAIQDDRMHANIHAAYKSYIKLVGQGWDVSKGDSTTLGNFIRARTFDRASKGSAPYEPKGVKVPPVAPAGSPAPTVAPSGSAAPDVPVAGSPAPSIAPAGDTAPSVPGAGSAAPDIPDTSSVDSITPPPVAAGSSAPDVPDVASADAVTPPDVVPGSPAPDIPTVSATSPENVPDIKGVPAPKIPDTAKTPAPQIPHEEK
jgi:hypothetical protein